MKKYHAIVVLLLAGLLSLAGCKKATHQTARQYGTPFKHVPDARDATIYEVNIRAFSKAGNLQGVTARLDSIKALGVNVIYLMPIYPVGKVKSKNSPYCVRNYRKINKHFGTLADLRTLVRQAHKRNMAVILDWVANHTSFDNPWTKHKSWYLRDSTGAIESPPGMGWNDVAQLNYKNPQMRQAMIKAMKYWVYKANIDGFRCDYADGPPFSFWKTAIHDLRTQTGHLLLMLAESGNPKLFKAGFNYIFGFSFYGNLKAIYNKGRSVTSIDSLNQKEYRDAADTQRVVRYLTNHDVNSSDGTALKIFGGRKGSLAAFVVVAYMKGVPFVYNGQEIGKKYPLKFPFTGKNIDWSAYSNIEQSYKKIIALRNRSEAIRRGKLTSYSNHDVCAFTKTLGSKEVLVLSNLRNKTVRYALPKTVENTSWVDAFSQKPVHPGSDITLKPYEYEVYQKR